MANDRLSLMSPSLYRVIHIPRLIASKNRRVSSELSYSRQDLGLSCNDIFLKNFKNEYLIWYVLNPRGKKSYLRRGLFFDICTDVYSGMKQRIHTVDGRVTCQCA